MGVESFNHRKPALSSAPDVQLVGQLWGDPVDRTMRANAPGSNIQPAGLFSTAPYTGPGADQIEQPKRVSKGPDIRRVSDGARVINGKPRCKANNDTCMGMAFNHEYCLGHRKSFGLLEVKPSTSRD
jgi:hypothetical protein